MSLSPLPSSVPERGSPPVETPGGEAASDAVLLPPQVFYRIDSSRVTMREYAWGTKSPLALLVAAIFKIGRAQISSSTDDPNVESLAPFEIGPAALPEAERLKLEPMLAELAALGFRDPVYHLIDDSFHLTWQFLVTFRHESGEAVARAHYRQWAIRTPPKDVIFAEFITELPGPRYVWSLASKADMLAPACCEIVRKAGAPAAELWAQHRAAVHREMSKAGSVADVVRVRDRGELIDFIERHHAVVRDFHVRRGVFATMDESHKTHAAEIARQRDAGVAYPEVLHELDKIQRVQTNWTNAVLLLVVSMVLFAGAGRAYGSWRFALLLIPILLFHEAGHYLAMRVFKYRNLRMFFIPFFGAAVSGQNFTAPGWKKVVVALMGPLPGIVLGGVLGFAGVMLVRPLLIELGILMLILNGFNLLPVFPLDGGRVMHALFFSRHYLLDTLFRAVAALALLAGGFLIGDWALRIIGVVMLISIVTAYRLARIAAELRRAGVTSAVPPALPGAPEDPFVPAAVATPIIARIREGFGKALPPKAVAQHTLAVYETIVSRPPGWLATVAFAVTHAGSLVLAIVLLAMLTLAQRPGFSFGDLRRAAAMPRLPMAKAPEFSIEPASITVHAASDAPRATTRPVHTVIATFASPEGAAVEYESVAASAPPRSVVGRFGQSVVVAIYGDDAKGTDEQRRRWVERLEPMASEICVHNEKFATGMRLQFVATDEASAQALQAQMTDYLAAARDAHLVAPWSPEQSWTPADHDRFARARRTYALLLRSRWGDAQKGDAADQRSQTKVLVEQRNRAARRGDADEVEKAEAAMAASSRRFELARIAKVRDRGNDEVDVGVADLYRAAVSRGGADDGPLRVSPEMAVLLGQLPLKDGRPLPGSDRFSAEYGYATVEGRTVQLDVTFLSPLDGASALTGWLSSKGCAEFRYAFRPGHYDEDSDEELPGE